MATRKQPNGWNLARSGGAMIYVTHEGAFVARFKYANAGKSATAFIKFLVANFTPAEYFAALAAGAAPAQALEAKGFVSYNAQIAEKVQAEARARMGAAA